MYLSPFTVNTKRFGDILLKDISVTEGYDSDLSQSFIWFKFNCDIHIDKIDPTSIKRDGFPDERMCRGRVEYIIDHLRHKKWSVNKLTHQDYFNWDKFYDLTLEDDLAPLLLRHWTECLLTGYEGVFMRGEMR